MTPRVFLLPVEDSELTNETLAWFLANVYRSGDFVQVLHVVDKITSGFDELLNTDIRMKSSPVNDPAADFAFERIAKSLKEKGVDHRVDVLRCSNDSRTVGEVIVTSAARVHAAAIVMGCSKKSLIAELIKGSSTNIVTHNSSCPVIIFRK